MSRSAALIDIAALFVLLFLTWVLAEIAAGILIAIVTSPTFGGVGLGEDDFRRIALLPSLAFRLLASIAVVAGIIVCRRQKATSVGITRSSLGINCLLGAAAMGVSYGLIMLWQLLVWFNWPDLVEQMDENLRRLLALIPKAHPLTFGAVACVVGIYEELIFRGFLMPRLRRATGSWTAAVILSTVVFTVPHLLEQTAAALVPIAILSLVFSLVTVWRHSLIPAIIGHGLFDWSQFIGLHIMGGDTWV